MKHKKQDNQKFIIGLLCMVIMVQWIYIIATRPKKEEPVTVTPPAKKPPKHIVLQGKIAIVLDDWGYNLNNLQALKQIKYPLTLSILPNLPYSKEIAAQAKNLGFEIILHLPMEPYENFRLEKDTILTTMDDKKIDEILRKDLADIKYAKGISNHMGSKATGDTRVMNAIFNQLENKELYFLDSFVSAKTVAPRIARQKGVRFAKRDVFLDNDSDYDYIKGQLYKLKSKAKNYGFAIGIGHDRTHTLEVLKEIMPEMAKEGFKFVAVSDLVN